MILFIDISPFSWMKVLYNINTGKNEWVKKYIGSCKYGI